LGKEWKIEKSRQFFEKAMKYLPGGASSNLRGFPVYTPHPIYIKRGKGSKCYDVDGNEYIDYQAAYGALILGHCHPKVTEAVLEQIRGGTMFGIASELEFEAAEQLNRMVPSVEMVRWCCSGTEATMTAMRLARGYTGKDKIIKFEGHYHGSHDYVCCGYHPNPSDWGSRISPSTQRLAFSTGVPEDTLKSVITIPWNDLELLEKVIRRHKDEIGGVITEPIMGNGGMIFPRKGYLEGMRELTEDNEIVLIFDEVVTGFRVARGGASEYLGVRPDLHTFGKAIANGYPISVFGGKKEIMSQIKPGGAYHSGTYAGNPLGLAAALATMKELDNKAAYKRMYWIGEKLINGLRKAAERADEKIFIPGFAGFFQIYFTDKTDFYEWRDVAGNIGASKYNSFVWELYKRGVYMHPSVLERIHLTMAHSEDDVEQTVAVAEEAFKAAKARGAEWTLPAGL